MTNFFFRTFILCIVMLLLSPFSYCADVNITVNGKVVAKPCVISTPSAEVDIGDIYTSSMTSPGSYAPWHEIILTLNNCPVGTSMVTASFSGVSDSYGYYANQGTAGNIQIELQNKAGEKLSNSSKMSANVDGSTLSAIIALRVRAVSVNGKATQGTIKTAVNVTYTWF